MTINNYFNICNSVCLIPNNITVRTVKLELIVFMFKNNNAQNVHNIRNYIVLDYNIIYNN